MHSCDIFWLDPTTVDEAYLDVLSDIERERMAALRRREDRLRFGAAAALLRTVAGSESGTAPHRVAVVRSCPDCQRPHGRPTLPGLGLHASVSHSGARVAVALTRIGPVGVDVEESRDVLFAELSERVLGTGEQAHDLAAFYTYWTRKESAVKATGDGLRVSLSGVRVSRPDEPARLLGYPGRPDLAAWLADLKPRGGHAGAVTVLTGEPVSVREHHLAGLP